MLNIGLLICICCSLLRNVTLIPVMRGENLTRSEPEVGKSRVDLRLTFYTSGFV